MSFPSFSHYGTIEEQPAEISFLRLFKQFLDFSMDYRKFQLYKSVL